MGLFSNPLGYAGYPPGATATANKVNSTVRAATQAEATAGTRNDVYLSPATDVTSLALDFASPPVLGFGSTNPAPVHARALSSTGSTKLASGLGNSLKLGNATGTVGFFGSAGAPRASQHSITNNLTSGGATGTLANFTGASYASDAHIIHNDIYQLGHSLQTLIASLKSYGLLT